MYNLIFPSIIILLYSIIRGFINKNIMKDLTPYELTITTWILGGIIGIICLILLPFINKTFNIKINYNFNNNKKYYKLLLLLTIFGIFSSFSYFYLLNLTNVRKMISYFNPLKILSIILISYFLFNEEITFGSIIGMSFIIIGLIITAYFDTKNN